MASFTFGPSASKFPATSSETGVLENMMVTNRVPRRKNTAECDDRLNTVGNHELVLGRNILASMCLSHMENSIRLSG